MKKILLALCAITVAASLVTAVSAKESSEQTSRNKADGDVGISFSDVSGHWAESYIAEAVKHGLFKGDSEGRFNPDANITRAQFVTVLWRMSGNPAVDVEAPFSDVQTQSGEFKSAISWAHKNGYVNGVSETRFDPRGELTREAAMKILYSYSERKDSGGPIYSQIYDSAFKDSKDVSPWAKQAMYWGIYNELISGTGKDTLNPQGTATRAQLAKILVEYIGTKEK